MANGIAILMYHELEIPGRPLCQTDPGYRRYVVPTAMLETQLSQLKSLGYAGISIGQALRGIQPSQVVITFDDGSETDLKVAAPMLLDLGFAATFYVTAGFPGRPGYMSESQVRELRASGFEIGCHSMTHPNLTELDSAALDVEVVDAKKKLEQILGQAVEHYSCPNGRFNHQIVAKVRDAGYSSFATSHPHLYAGLSDRYSIGRIPVLRNTTVRQIQNVCEGRGLWALACAQSSRRTIQSLLGDRLYDGLRSSLLSRSD